MPSWTFCRILRACGRASSSCEETGRPIVCRRQTNLPPAHRDTALGNSFAFRGGLEAQSHGARSAKRRPAVRPASSCSSSACRAAHRLSGQGPVGRHGRMFDHLRPPARLQHDARGNNSEGARGPRVPPPCGRISKILPISLAPGRSRSDPAILRLRCCQNSA
jgi:hypothetical protein